VVTHVSLFTGIGGLDLAAEAAGFETVLQVEREPFPLRVLEKHWPDVPRITEVREVHRDELWNEPTVISGGFPCQPFSAAGKRRGADDDRYLWPEMLRVINEIRPTYVVAENVENAVRMVVDDVQDSLERIGYSSQSIVVPADIAGAWFSGKRTFILATTNNGRATVRRNVQFQTDAKTHGGRTDHRRREAVINARQRWEVEPRPAGVADGIPNRMDRLKALGNSVVPAQAYPIFAAIAHAEANNAK
jgi:DNA (cytosine-5)-methyltransferase 1